MQFYRCKCGNATSHTSMGVPSCVACSKCGSDLAPGPTSHREPTSHDFVTKYDQNTGAPYEICKNCLRRRAELEKDEVTS